MKVTRFKTTFAENIICYKCKQEKPTTAFALTVHKTTARRGWQSYCRECMREYRTTIPKELRSEQSKRSYHKLSSNPKNKLKRLLNASTTNRKELDFDWCWARLEQSSFCCEITKQPFTRDTRSPTSLSIDRIDPTKGYTKDNVRFVCWWINAAMGNWGLETLVTLIKEWNAN